MNREGNDVSAAVLGGRVRNCAIPIYITDNLDRANRAQASWSRASTSDEVHLDHFQMIFSWEFDTTLSEVKHSVPSIFISHHCCVLFVALTWSSINPVER